MIEKPSILITSLGRTGTEFFARLFAAIIPDATSLHEPDIFQNTGVKNKWGHYLYQIRRAGIWRMVFLKALGKWTLVNLSDATFLGRLDQKHSVVRLNAQRNSFIQGLPGSVYVEANIGYYGLLNITPFVFREHKAVYIVRDGRDWVQSHMNWGEFYGKQGIRRLISHNWPMASDLPNDPYSAIWSQMSRFEQLCWAWTRLNQYALETLSKNPNAQVFQFERIFSRTERYQALKEVVNFAVSLSNINNETLGSTEGWLERKIHSSSRGFPAWEHWTSHQKTHFEHICGPLMEKLNYKLS